MSAAQILLFRAGGLRLGVSIADIGRLVVEDTVVAVPFAHPALAGLLRAGDDGPVPVFDLHGLIKGATIPPPTGRSTVALFLTARGLVGLRLEHLEGTVSSYAPLHEQEGEALRAGVSAALLATVTGAASAPAGPFFLFSPEAFLGALGL